ncbi:MAG: uroporphyrinogen decarboxylase family protein, partial [Smithellaceae bacterium]|nr:uroporphyrinogen decarboxylase family protein [Smithellaceae bacterium]
MSSMSPVERVLRQMEGRPVDRVPCFCAMMESRTANEIIGKPLVGNEFIMNLPVSKFFMNNWGPQLTKTFARPNLIATINRRNLGQVEMGFDAIWAYYDDSWIFVDAGTIALTTGSIHKLIPDGFGDMTYMYKGPGITTPAEFDAWPYWPNGDDVAHRVYKYFKKFCAKYGDKTCIFGYGFFGGLHETMNWTFGIDKAPIWIRKHPQYVARFLDMLEEVTIKSHVALMDAGCPVVLQTDDFAYKTGPFLSPKMVEDIFGDRYRRIIKNILSRGRKYGLHSCGDNTRL